MVVQRIWASLFSPPRGKLALRSAILWGLGDVGAQAVTHYSAHAQAQDKDKESISFRKKDKEFKIDWFRVLNTSVFGFGTGSSIGPAGYYGFSKLLQRGSSITTTADVVASAVVNGLLSIDLVLFFPFTGFFQGRTRSLEQAKQDVKRGFTPALVLGGAALPAALFTNWRFVPAPYQFHCASLFCLLGSFSLSWIEQQRDDAESWKHRFLKMEVHKSK